MTGIQLLFWPVWLSAHGMTAGEIGIVLAAATWTKVIATPHPCDRLGRRRAVMGTLAAGFWILLGLDLVTLPAQSALMPLGDTVPLLAARSSRVDYGRVRV